MNRTRRTTLAAAFVTGAVVLSGCSGSSSSSTPAADGSTTPSTPSGTSTKPDNPPSSSSPSAANTGVVDGVQLTFPGSKLKVGDTARVSWNPNQKTTGVIKVTVDKLEKVPISTFSDFRLTGTVRRSTPYFVHATVTNLGKSDLSHAAVPLYLLDGRNTLLQTSSFQALFPPCPSRALPAKFTRGKKASVCLVYFVPHHGKLVAISFRPTEDFDAITWTGKTAKPKKKQKKS